jgi:hypothetical protein
MARVRLECSIDLAYLISDRFPWCCYCADNVAGDKLNRRLWEGREEQKYQQIEQLEQQTNLQRAVEWC